MIRTLVASTENIDDLDAAVADIKTQLDVDHQLLKNSVGIIACHYEFANSGAVKAVCDALPFEIAGTISSVQGVNGKAATLLLTIFVITSDEVSFKTAITPSLKENSGKTIEETYKGCAGNFVASSAGSGKPALIFAFAPFMLENSGDEYVNVLTKASGGVPCFGTLAVDDTADFHECFMLYQGVHYRDRMSLILVYGELNPRFFLGTISQSKILEQPALVTSSEGHILKEVNGRPVVEYFEDRGLTKASETSYAMTSLPFMLDYGDGTPPVSKVFIGLNENKQAICAGAMPEGSTLYLGVFDKDDVLLTSRKTIQDALKNSAGASGILIYSCISRSMSLGSELFAEMDLIRKETGNKLPLMMAYSGGEICPTQINKTAGGNSAEAIAINRFHNNTFVLCIF
jgi:hypothetical protein